MSSQSNHSGLPEKVGQLVAALHQCIVGKIIRCLLKGFNASEPVCQLCELCFDCAHYSSHTPSQLEYQCTKQASVVHLQGEIKMM